MMTLPLPPVVGKLPVASPPLSVPSALHRPACPARAVLKRAVLCLAAAGAGAPLAGHAPPAFPRPGGREVEPRPAAAPAAGAERGGALPRPARGPPLSVRLRLVRVRVRG